MGTLFNFADKLSRMVFGIARGRVHTKPASIATGVWAIRRPINVRPTACFDKAPSVRLGETHGLTDVFVWMFRHQYIVPADQKCFKCGFPEALSTQKVTKGGN